MVPILEYLMRGGDVLTFFLLSRSEDLLMLEINSFASKYLKQYSKTAKPPDR
jgi:hypothetical protein